MYSILKPFYLESHAPSTSLCDLVGASERCLDHNQVTRSHRLGVDQVHRLRTQDSFQIWCFACPKDKLGLELEWLGAWGRRI